MLYERDVLKEQVDVGDIVVFAIRGCLYFGYVLGLTPYGIYISERNKRYELNVSLHDKKRYYRYVSFKIIEKHAKIPEQLKSLCNFNQMRRDDGFI